MKPSHIAGLISCAFLIVMLCIMHNATETRKQYGECLRITEELLKADPKRISTPYCRN